MASVLRPVLLAGATLMFAASQPLALAEEPRRAVRLNSVGYLPGGPS